MEGTVVIFSRVPVLGRVKTRLARTVGDRIALNLHRAFLADSIQNASGSGARVVLSHTGDSEIDPGRDDVEMVVQDGESFGERFDHTLQEVARRFPGPLILIGADTPHLDHEAISSALEYLQDYDAVLGPSTDGGFYLIGFRQQPLEVRSGLNTRNDGAAMMDILRGAGLKVRLLPFFFDIDVEEDLVNLVLYLEVRERTISAQTRRVLEEEGIEVARTGDNNRGWSIQIDG